MAAATTGDDCSNYRSKQDAPPRRRRGRAQRQARRRRTEASFRALSTAQDSRPLVSRNFKLTLAYDGTDFYGWQVQPQHATIQGELADAIERITGERVLPQGSGRTDAGVHALAQVASFCLQSPIPPENLLLALNHTLSPAIRATSVEEVAADFHARHSARAKTYE